MPWYIPHVPEGIKKRVCIYLLQRYFGRFFEEKLTLNQLSVDLYNGTGIVENVSLDVQALNELGEKQNWPLEFVDGYLEKLTVNVPWTSLLKDSTFVEVKGLKLTVQPKQRTENATSMFESMWSSMSNSMQMAQECMKQDPPNNLDNLQPLEGIERFAHTIDSILKRVKVKFISTVFQVEHVPKHSLSGVGVQIKIAVMEYFDESSSDPSNEDATNISQKDNKAYVVSSFTCKDLYLEGITFCTIEFPSRARTFSRSLLNQSGIFDKSEEKQDCLVAILQKTDNDNNRVHEELYELADNMEQQHAIMFGKITGRQEIRIRMKQSENMNGPKVSIETNLGSLTMFLSPRQVHILFELANGLATPDLEDTSNITPRQRCTEKPMTGVDYQRVEQELQHRIHPMAAFHTSGLQGSEGWSRAPQEENDDNFLPMRSATTAMYDSATSVASSSMESSFNSSTASSVSESSSRSKRKGINIETDPTAEISNFQIRIVSFVLVLLHEDILTYSTGSIQTVIVASVQQMQNTAKQFFDNLPFVTGYKDFDIVKPLFEKACHLSHLRLLATPIQVEAKETTTQTAFSVSGKLTASQLEILECLSNSKNEPLECVKLLAFSKTTSDSSTAASKPCLTMIFKHTERTSRSGFSRNTITPKTELGISLNNCTVEVDITIIDRISTLLNPLPVCIINKPVQNVWGTPKPNHMNTQLESRMDIRLTSPSLTLRLRFPMPDFRPHHDMQRTPWWKRHVRPDFLTLQFTDVLIQNLAQTGEVSQEYTLECRCLDVFYFETEKDLALQIAKAGINEKNDSYSDLQQDECNWPRIVLQILPEQKIDTKMEKIREPEVDLMSQSIYGTLISQTTKHGGPFSGKRVIHTSDTPHDNSCPQVAEDAEELIVPGDREEINQFINVTTKNSKIQLEIHLPIVSLQLVNKHIYEVLYNRINSDLLLWEPSAPKVKSPNFNNIITGLSNLHSDNETFIMCKSGIHYDSDSESEDDPEQYYSVYETKMKHSLKQRPHAHVETRSQSEFVLNLHITHGIIDMNTPVRDLSANVIPNQQGEFVFSIENATIFSVSGYCGDPNIGYVCILIKSAQMHHCDIMSTPSQNPSLLEVGTALPKYLHPTIVKSEPGILQESDNLGNKRDMVSLAIRIQASHETHHVKTVKLAIGLNKATLKHRVCLGANSWLTQLIDFFNVVDYAIPGYNAKDVLIELHLHLWNSAIDYRPLYLPLRAVVTLGNFSMSSHLSAQANTSTLRFIAEDSYMYLSEKSPPRNGIPSAAAVDLKRDYVNVIEMGLFELSLRSTDKKNGISSNIDMRASINILHIRTCADSGKALLQLIRYFASDGDLQNSNTQSTPNSSYSSPQHKVDQELVSVEAQGRSRLSEKQHEEVNELIGEAMQESLLVKASTSRPSNTGAELFFFPGESNLLPNTSKHLAQVANELGDTASLSNKSSDTDDDYCFLDNETGYAAVTRSGLPEIKWLIETPLHIIDNHFAIPVGKTDLLKPPSHFPTPTHRYSLRELTVVWHIYGGNDFMKPEKSSNKKNVHFSDSSTSLNVGFRNTPNGEVLIRNASIKKKPVPNWQIQGGVNRDHNVLLQLQLNKVKFQHEEYPEYTYQASRQVLLVTELEIRDRLQSSQMNKFLYHYISESRPKQSQAHMLVVKAVHVRPDPKLRARECDIRMSLLPLRINIDQDSLLFLIEFFSELADINSVSDDTASSSSKHSTPTHHLPVMTVSDKNEEEINEVLHTSINENLLQLTDEEIAVIQQYHAMTNNSNASEDSSPVYFRSIRFGPDVPIRLDYHGKRVDMTHGPLAGVLMGLGQLNCSELCLKSIHSRNGILGFDKLVTFCLHEWIEDIKGNQLPSLLGGVGPMHSLVQLFQGIKDLFWLPIEQYQKDGRIVRGLQRGANSFTKSTLMAALELTSRIINLVLITAETAYDMVSPGPSVKRTRYNQPQDFREGVAEAYMLVKEGLGETADNLVRVASHEREQKGYSGAVGGVLRQIPPTIVKPIIIASEATNKVLGGVRSQLAPDVKREAIQKWKNEG